MCKDRLEETYVFAEKLKLTLEEVMSFLHFRYPGIQIHLYLSRCLWALKKGNGCREKTGRRRKHSNRGFKALFLSSDNEKKKTTTRTKKGRSGSTT